MSVIEIAILRAHPDRGEELGRAADTALDIIRDFSECIRATALLCIERSDEVILEIEWTSIEAHEAFRAGEDFPRYRTQLADSLAEVVGVGHYRTLS